MIYWLPLVTVGQMSGSTKLVIVSPRRHPACSAVLGGVWMVLLALKRLGTRRGQMRAGALSGVAIERANANPTNAAVWTRALLNETEPRVAVLAVASEDVLTGPIKARRPAVELPENLQSADSIRCAATERAVQDPASPVAWAQQISVRDCLRCQFPLRLTCDL
jgi:hypothetical protein